MKYSRVMEKAGYQIDNDNGATNDVQQSKQVNQPPVFPSTSNNNRQKSPKHSKPLQPLKPLSGKWDERLCKAVHDDLTLPEVFKVLRSRILHPPTAEKPIKTILITSAVPKEGKSFIAANLGISLAQGMDQHALLVDCDLRRPSLASLFGMPENVGLVDFLSDGVALSELIGKTEIQKLSVLASGTPPANPAELLSSSRMHSLIEELSCRYYDRIIIFDSPPLLVAAETAVLAGQVDGVILVVRQGVSRKADIQKLLDKIGTERIIGVVFNDHIGGVFEKYYKNGYGYYHDSGAK